MPSASPTSRCGPRSLVRPSSVGRGAGHRRQRGAPDSGQPALPSQTPAGTDPALVDAGRRTCHGAAVRPGGEQDEPERAPAEPADPTGALQRAPFARSARAQALLALPGLGFFLPAFGPWLSLLAVGVAVQKAGPVLWDDRPRRPRALVLLGCAALWWPAVLAFVFLSFFGEHLGNPESDAGLRSASEAVDAVGITYWLFVPLAALRDWVSPAVAALAVVVLGAVASARVHRPWPWLLAAATAPLAYALVVDVLQIPFSA